jgi:hypothetical protein
MEQGVHPEKGANHQTDNTTQTTQRGDKSQHNTTQHKGRKCESMATTRFKTKYDQEMGIQGTYGGPYNCLIGQAEKSDGSQTMGTALIVTAPAITA